jgi:prepilin peptidase CpaA
MIFLTRGHTMLLLIVLCLYLIISVNDICYRRIPDIFSVALSFIGLGILIINGNWLEGFTTLGLAIATFFVLALLCMAGKLGGGDVKLLTASVLLVRVGSFFDFLLLTALAGGVLSLIYIAAFLMLKHLPTTPAAISVPPGKAPDTLRLNLLWRIERRRILRRSSIPYGVAISAGSLLALTTFPM